MGHVIGKLGNMRREVRWAVYPGHSPTGRTYIQCPRRIAMVDCAAGTAVLSSGRGGHQGFAMLTARAGATRVPVPPAMLAALRALPATGPVARYG